jgi:hypothetical protein
MSKFEIHLATDAYCEVGEDASVKLPPWSPSVDTPPRTVDVPDDLLMRYHAVMGEFWNVQAEMKKLYDAAPPHGAVRPK